MNTQNFKTQINNIREEAIKLGFAISTIDGYRKVWNQFIKWKNEEDFIYNENDYSIFLLEHYNFDVNKYNSKSKSRHQLLMRSKRILDNFDEYKKIFIKNQKIKHNDLPNEWNQILDNYLNFSKNVKQNSKGTINVKEKFLKKELYYFVKNNLENLSDFSNDHIRMYVNDAINDGKSTTIKKIYIFREFLVYLFMENIIRDDLSIYIPKIKQKNRIKIPTYIKQDKIEQLLDSITKNTKTEIRDYAIILIAARYGLRISDILNIKLKDIDWKDHKITIIQPKTGNLNSFPLTKEVGWAIIDYIKNSRPKCENEYLFVKSKYPFDKMEQFYRFNSYFDKIYTTTNNFNKKGIHNLRHSLAKNMLDNGIPISTIASTLGHKDLNTTSKTYLKIDIQNLKKCGLEVE